MNDYILHYKESLIKNYMNLPPENETNKVSVYIWDDGYWDTLEKIGSRKLSTIYLDGIEKQVLERRLEQLNPFGFLG